MKKAGNTIWNISVSVFFAISVLLAFSVLWVLRTWPDLKMDELIFHLTQPISGAADNMVIDYVLKALIPSLCAIGLILISVYLVRPAEKLWRIYLVLASLACLAISGISVYSFTDAGEYVITHSKESGFIQENYADPAKTEMTFPEQKRNLIYIFLESMETTFADEESGGAFEVNTIKKLTELAQENETFSDNSKVLNGAYSLPGTTWTIAGMFAATSGLPLQISIKDNDMSKQEQFFPGITVLGDILEDEGYRNVLLIGSNAGFGGRKVYFESHGNYEIRDYHYANDNGLIERDYKVWWGYEDNRLINFARDTLNELSASDQPFNLTMLTVDTHFENGYVCEDCPDTFGDNQYANVMACSSEKITEFVRWCQSQPWYENTTIILSGDHPTMDRDFCEDVINYDRRVYTAYINPAAENQQPDEQRIYSTFDNFPTTLASLGVSIEGERLGLGTNLFSEKMTLTEELGITDETALLKQKSAFMEAKSGISISAKDLYKEGNSLISADIQIRGYNENTGVLSVSANDILIGSGNIHHVRFILEDDQGTCFYEGKAEPDGSYSADIYVPYDRMETCSLRVAASYEENGRIYGDTVFGYSDGSLLHIGALQENPSGYFRYLSTLDPDRYTVLIAGQGDFTVGIDDEIMESLYEMGCQYDLRRQWNTAYIAVRSQQGMIERTAQSALNWGGAAGNTLWVQMASSSNLDGSASSIRIYDGINGAQECSMKEDGLNVAVYDHFENRVVSKTCFDTTYLKPGADVSFEKEESGNLFIQVEKIRNKNDVRNVYGVIFDEDNPARKIPFTLNADEAGGFNGEADLTGINCARAHLIIMASDLSGVPQIVYRISGNMDEWQSEQKH